MTVEPTLLVAVPLVAGALAVVADLIPGGEPIESGDDGATLAFAVTAVALAVQTALAAAVAARAITDGPVRTAVGGIAEPYAITLVVDGLSAPFLVLTALVGLGTLGYVRGSGPRSGPFFALYLLLVGGVTGVYLTADAFNLYVFLEISGLASYALVARGEGPRAALAALKYLLVGTVGASLYLLGVAYVYVASGTLSMAALADALAAAGGLDGTLAVTAFGLMAVGLGVKAALFPLHVWKPEAYAQAPPAVAGLLAALISTAAAYALVRLLLSAFTVRFVRAVPLVETGLVAAGVLSVATGSLLAFRSSDVRRLLAYSSVAQMGIVAVGIGLVNPTGFVGVVVHLVGHAVTKGGFYLAAGALAAGYGVRTVDDYAGLAGRAPLLSGAVAVFALGLVGLPPTVGFAGKLYVLLAAAEGGATVAAAVVLASTLASLAYFGRLLQRVFVEPVREGPDAGGAPVGADSDESSADGDGRRSARAPDRHPSTGALAVILVAAVLTVALGLGAASIGGLVDPTVARLVG
ncbi:proton-conducting transporter transmembrane domain-containing protein [Halosimplex amylolyticum]|uniref:proton-conducting transporter transmembrane domain-containing protein n=1 Tax=Halosimplex amylolyticum TaxID=3396616 RepID=UPI003F5706C7